MKKLIIILSISILLSIIIYCSIAAILIINGNPQDNVQNDNELVFNELFIDYTDLPKPQQYMTRDGNQLSYRFYPSQSNKIIIFLHGSGWHSQYFLPLATFVSSEGLAKVYTPDLRGHGQSPKRRGDIDYIGQFEDDIVDFITLVKKHNPDDMIILGGHSSGGGLAIRFAGSRYCSMIDAFLLMSPYLQYNAPTIKQNSGGWARPYTGRIIGLSMLNNIGVHWFDHLTVIDFNMPLNARDGTETLSYSYRLNKSFAPRNYKKDLSAIAINQPILVVVGTADESFIADQFKPVFSLYTKAEVEMIKDLSHMGVVLNAEVQPVIKEWIQNLKWSMN